MSGTSTTAGLLAPTGPGPVTDQALDIILQNYIVGLTGMPGSMVRVRYQPAPPAVPLQSLDWAVVGFMHWNQDANAYLSEALDGLSASMQRHESATALASFAGPNCNYNAALVRDGSMIRQNRVQLAVSAGLYLVDVGPLRLVPELVNEVWVPRVDIELTFNRQLDRSFPIRRLENSTPTIIDNLS